MRIMHVIDGLARGGAERMLVDLANLTAKDGHQVTVCVTGTDPTLARELAPSIRVVVLARRSRITPFALAKLIHLVRQVDVVHAHMRSSAGAIAMLRAAHVVRTPLVFHDHFGGIEYRSVPRWLRYARRQVTQYVGVYSLLADWARDAGIPDARVAIIPNALDLRRLANVPPYDLRSALRLPNDTVLAILVASLRRDKGVEVMIEALARARHRERIHVALVGGDGEPAYAAALRRRVSALGLFDRVTFMGARDDVPSLLATADVGLLASHAESGPLVLLEYLAAGLPIVATRVGDIGNRLATEHVMGFVDAGDAVAFANELDAVAALSPAARRARGDRGRAILDARFDLAAVMPRWYEVYSGAIAQRTCGS
jgi:glycosyltransferase involved in cell wall biosynthesis